MLTTFKVILIIIMIASLLGTIGSDIKERMLSMASICITCILALTFLLVWL